MKLVRTQCADDLQVELKNRFTSFNRTSSPAKGRHYPADLKQLVCKALMDGVAPRELRRITGVSSSTLCQWGKVSKRTASPKVIPPRRLEVTQIPATQHQSMVTVKFPSGVAIEFSSVAVLSREFLASLAAVEICHAASR